MLDAVEGLRNGDIKIIEYVVKSGAPCAILVNKWDMVTGIDQPAYESALKEKLRLIEWVPVIFISCKDRTNLFMALDLASSLKERANLSIKTTRLNNLLQQSQASGLQGAL